MIPELRDLSYVERVTTLETRMLREYQIEVLKILNGFENIDSNIFFSHTKYNTYQRPRSNISEESV